MARPRGLAGHGGSAEARGWRGGPGTGAALCGQEPWARGARPLLPLTSSAWPPEGPDSKAQLGTRAPASPPEQDSPVGQSHGKLKVCGDLVSGKSVRAVSLASAHFMSLSCFGNPHNISNFFIVIRLAKVIWDQ